MRELFAYLDGVRVGTVAQSRQGALTFTYAEEYLRGPRPTPLSLSMSTRVSRHPNKPISAFIDGLLPDNRQVRERWGRLYGVSPNSPFALLRHVGRDAAGAVQLLPPDAASDDAAERRGDVEWLSADDVVSLLDELAQHAQDWDPGPLAGRWSLAGAQAKVALYRDPRTQRWGVPRDSTPTTHILKPSILGLADHHLNEVLCLRTASALGLPAAQIDVIEGGSVQAIVSTRFDRLPDAAGTVRRMHQEDLCQALAVHPELKYQQDGGPGVARVADLLATLDVRDRDVSRQRFFDGLAFNVLIGGTDGHAKNYALLLAGDRAQLAPLYDVASAAPYGFEGQPVSAMRIGEHYPMRAISAHHWAQTGRRIGLGAEASVARVRELRAGLSDALAAAVAGLPESVRHRADRIAVAIEQHANRLP